MISFKNRKLINITFTKYVYYFTFVKKGSTTNGIGTIIENIHYFVPLKFKKLK